MPEFPFDPDPTYQTNTVPDDYLHGFDLEMLQRELDKEGAADKAAQGDGGGKPAAKPPTGVRVPNISHRMQEHQQRADETNPEQRYGREAQNESEHNKHLQGDAHESQRGERNNLNTEVEDKYLGDKDRHTFAADVLAEVYKD
jgi:hypothetical protein